MATIDQIRQKREALQAKIRRGIESCRALRLDARVSALLQPGREAEQKEIDVALQHVQACRESLSSAGFKSKRAIDERDGLLIRSVATKDTQNAIISHEKQRTGHEPPRPAHPSIGLPVGQCLGICAEVLVVEDLRGLSGSA